MIELVYSFIYSFPYLSWHIIFVIFPSIALWIIYWSVVKEYKYFLLKITGLSFFWGFIFCIVGSVYLDIWFYKKTLGLFLFGLPLEEYMFLLLVPQFLSLIFILITKKFYD